LVAARDDRDGNGGGDRHERQAAVHFETDSSVIGGARRRAN
jgi:hypothetical protein